MLPDLDSLALFVRAAELGNLTRAAQACAITVPAASRRLSVLEHQLKVSLFERHSRGMQLTPAGRRLLQLAGEVIASVQHIRSEMSEFGKGQGGVLRVHGNTSAMAQFLPADIASFSATHAGIRVVLEESWSDDAVRRLRGGDTDLAVVVEGVDLTGLHVLPYRNDQLAVVMRDNDPLREELPLSFSDLHDRDLVGLEGSSALTRLLESRAAQLNRPMALRVQVRSFEAVCRAVEAGLGIGVLPLAAARGLAAGLGLRVEPLQDAWASRVMRLCTRVQPQPRSPLGVLTAHLHAMAH